MNLRLLFFCARGARLAARLHVVRAHAARQAMILSGAMHAFACIFWVVKVVRSPPPPVFSPHPFYPLSWDARTQACTGAHTRAPSRPTPAAGRARTCQPPCSPMTCKESPWEGGRKRVPPPSLPSISHPPSLPCAPPRLCPASLLISRRSLPSPSVSVANVRLVVNKHALPPSHHLSRMGPNLSSLLHRRSPPFASWPPILAISLPFAHVPSLTHSLGPFVYS
jgi:hypothetical protein